LLSWSCGEWWLDIISILLSTNDLYIGKMYSSSCIL
jgi:hypothetical protein